MVVTHWFSSDMLFEGGGERDGRNYRQTLPLLGILAGVDGLSGEVRIALGLLHFQRVSLTCC